MHIQTPSFGRSLVRSSKLLPRSLARVLACSLILCAGVPALAQPASDTATAEDFAFAKRLSRVFKTVAERRERSVVHITQLRTVTPTDWFGRPVGRGNLQQSGLGSGVIVSEDGVIITNNHVIRGADKLRVKLNDEREFDARILGTDEATDLAVLKIEVEGQSLPAVGFADSDQIEVGEWVVAIGSPFGLDNSVTQGIISAKGRTVTPRETGISFEDYIQTDAAINPGNSGGPLLNLEGQIVGINTAIASRTGGYDGIGFAIPSNTVKNVLDSITRTGRVARGFLGVDMTDADDGGVVIQRVVEDSPADKAGLRAGDVVTRFQGNALPLPRLRNAIAATPAGSKVNIEVRRDGETRTVQATLGDLSAARGFVYFNDLGIEVASVPAKNIRNLEIDSQTVVAVVSIQETGRAAMSGLRENDLIVSVNGRGYDSVDELRELLTKVDFTEGVRLNVLRPIGDGGYRRGNLVVQD
jgi:serine protease Do